MNPFECDANNSVVLKELFESDSLININIQTDWTNELNVVLEIKMKDGTSKQYYKELFPNNDEAYVKKIKDLDQGTNIVGGLDVITFGSDIHKKLGELLTKISEKSNELVEKNIPEDISRVFELMNELNMEHIITQESASTFFKNKKKDTTLDEYLIKFQTTKEEVGTIVVELRDKIDSIKGIVVTCDELTKSNDILKEDLEICILVGELILNREEIKEEYLKEQFEKRITDLKAF